MQVWKDMKSGHSERALDYCRTKIRDAPQNYFPMEYNWNLSYVRCEVLPSVVKNIVK